jgi:hypothetical protein
MRASSNVLSSCYPFIGLENGKLTAAACSDTAGLSMPRVHSLLRLGAIFLHEHFEVRKNVLRGLACGDVVIASVQQNHLRAIRHHW